LLEKCLQCRPNISIRMNYFSIKQKDNYHTPTLGTPNTNI
jgi:hypothetical protein